MSSSEILQDKLILAVDDEEDILDIIEEELSESANCTLHRATTFEKAQQYLVSYTYDLVILGNGQKSRLKIGETEHGSVP